MNKNFDNIKLDRLFFGNLSFDLDENAILEYCKSWGELKECRLMRDRRTNKSRGFAFVRFSHRSSAHSFYNTMPHYICDCRITIRPIPETNSKVFLIFIKLYFFEIFLIIMCNFFFNYKIFVILINYYFLTKNIFIDECGTTS